MQSYETRYGSSGGFESAFTNVIIEVANEYNVGAFNDHRLVSDPGDDYVDEGRQADTGGMPVGSSGGGLVCSREVAGASDVVPDHGNTARRQDYYRLVTMVKSWELSRPVVCNEDSPCYTQLDVAYRTHTS